MQRLAAFPRDFDATNADFAKFLGWWSWDRCPSLRGFANRMGWLAQACLVLAAGSCSGPTNAGACNPGDADGVTGLSYAVDLTVSDTAFSVGGPDSGSTEPNIAVQNLSTVTLTMTNVGTRPHDFVVECLPTPNEVGCPAQSCFPPAANLPAVQPGHSATTTFMTPAQEGAYEFLSNESGDTQASPDGGVEGLVGELVLM